MSSIDVSDFEYEMYGAFMTPAADQQRGFNKAGDAPSPCSAEIEPLFSADNVKHGLMR